MSAGNWLGLRPPGLIRKADACAADPPKATRTRTHPASNEKRPWARRMDISFRSSGVPAELYPRTRHFRLARMGYANYATQDGLRPAGGRSSAGRVRTNQQVGER